MANKKQETSTKNETNTSTKNTTQKKKAVAKKTEVKANTKKVESKKTIKESVPQKQEEQKQVSKKQTEVKVKTEKKEPTQKEIASKVASEPPVSSDELMRLTKIVLIVIVIVVLFYGITVLMTKYKKEKTENEVPNTTPAVIQYDEIMLGTLFRQPRDEYYVLIQKEEDPYNSLFESYITTYSSKAEALKVYTANLDSIFNSYYIGEKSNLKTDNISEFKVSDISLVKVKEKSVVESYEGMEEIEKALKELIK